MNLLELLLLSAALLFSIGLAVVIVKRNIIMMLVGLELMLNAANLNLVAFNRLWPETFQGQMFSVFVIIVAVCEAAVGLAIAMQVYRHYGTSVPDEVNELKG